MKIRDERRKIILPEQGIFFCFVFQDTRRPYVLRYFKCSPHYFLIYNRLKGAAHTRARNNYCLDKEDERVLLWQRHEISIVTFNCSTDSIVVRTADERFRC